MADQSPEAGFRQQVAQYFDQLETVVREAKSDVEAFTIKDNSAAGTRVRKVMQTVKELGQNVRNAVQDAKNEDKKAKE